MVAVLGFQATDVTLTLMGPGIAVVAADLSVTQRVQILRAEIDALYVGSHDHHWRDLATCDGSSRAQCGSLRTKQQILANHIPDEHTPSVTNSVVVRIWADFVFLAWICHPSFSASLGQVRTDDGNSFPRAGVRRRMRGATHRHSPTAGCPFPLVLHRWLSPSRRKTTWQVVVSRGAAVQGGCLLFLQRETYEST